MHPVGPSKRSNPFAARSLYSADDSDPARQMCVRPPNASAAARIPALLRAPRSPPVPTPVVAPQATDAGCGCGRCAPRPSSGEGSSRRRVARTLTARRPRRPPRRRDDHRQQQAQGIDEDTGVSALGLLAAVVAVSRPISVVFTVWLSIEPALGSVPAGSGAALDRARHPGSAATCRRLATGRSNRRPCSWLLGSRSWGNMSHWQPLGSR